MSKILGFFRDLLTPLAVLILAGVVAYDHFAPKSAPAPSTVDGQALGLGFAPTLASSLGDAWLIAADALESGKSVGEAQKALQDAWKEARVKAFAAKVAPEFALVLSEGTEPTAPAKRAEVVKLWRDFASGLKGGKR
jgi:hypothetical protein